MTLVLFAGSPIAAGQAAKQLVELPERRLPQHIWWHTGSVVVHDFDADGDPDLVRAGSQGLLLLANDGHGRFTDVTNGMLDYGAGGVRACAFTDVDGDQRTDLVAGESTFLRVWLGTASGVFRFDSTRSRATTGLTIGAGLFDLDGDGDLDCVAGNWGTPSVSLYVNSGGRFVDESTARLPATPERLFVRWFAAADVDRDGDVDLILAEEVRLRLYENVGAGRFADASARLPVGVRGAQFVEAADIDGDGDVDIVAQTRILQNDGRGTFTDATAQLLPFEPIARVTRVADLDADGRPDLYVGTDGTDHLFVGRGGKLVDVTAERLAAASAPTSAVTAFDADHDGDLDVVLGRPIGLVLDQLLTNRHRHLDLGPAALSKPLSIEVFADPGYDTGPRLALPMLGLDAAQSPVAIPPFGWLQVDLGRVVCLLALPLPAGVPSAVASVAIPADPGLLNHRAVTQAIVFHSPVLVAAARLSGLESRTVTR